jgi:hypothetical protein
MSDITACSGISKTNAPCPIKDKCYRYTAPKSDYQSWFVEVPGKITEVDGKYVFNCDMFWGESNESIMNQLRNICGE